MHHPLGQLAVVGHDQQALGVHVEAAHRVEPHAQLAHELGHRAAALFVLERGDVAAGFVKHYVNLFLRRGEAFPVDGDPVARRVGPVAERGDRAVDPHLPRRDQFLGGAAGHQSRGGYDLLQSLFHVYPVSSPRRATPRRKISFTSPAASPPRRTTIRPAQAPSRTGA